MDTKTPTIPVAQTSLSTAAAAADEQSWLRYPQQAIDLKTLHPDATFLRILGVNYVHIKTQDDGDLYLTQHGVPFIRQLNPRNWYEDQWFTDHRVRLQGTSTVYRIPTRPVEDSSVPSLDIVIKWSRVGQDVALDTFALQRNINAEFNTPFEEFARIEELRNGDQRARELKILTQRPLAIYVPPEQMQPWQTGRSKDRILARVARHPGIEIDVLRAYIMLYAWIDGFSAVDAFQACVHDPRDSQKQLEELTIHVDEELRAKGFVVADHKPTHLIVRIKNGQIVRRRDGKVLYGLVDYELLARTADYEDWVRAAKRREYLSRQKNRFVVRADVTCPAHLKPSKVLGVPFIVGRAESTQGLLWVVGNDPELFAYFLPERWRTENQVRLSDTGQTYYAQTKDRTHLVWKVSRVGEFPPGHLGEVGYRQLLLHGYNSPFEEFQYALELSRRGVKTVYPRAIYMTASPGAVSGAVLDDRRFERMKKIVAPTGQPVMPMNHDYVTIWGYWRGLEDDQAVEDTMLWTPIDVANATTKGVIDQQTGRLVMQRHADAMAKAGFCDLKIKPDHILISYVPSGSVKTDAQGTIESRQCNFELVKQL